MITSALISQCRREFGDNPESTRVERTGDGSATLFNVGKFPIIEGSYTIKKGTSAQTETTHFTLDKQNGDLVFLTAPLNSYATRAEFKFANWNDQNWLEALNEGIEDLNGKGFFKQVVKDRSLMALSAKTKEYTGPSGCISLYEVLESDDYTTSGNFKRLAVNHSYQQGANKLVLGDYPSKNNPLEISFLKNMQTYSATSATLDVLTDWLPLVRKYAGARFTRFMAGKIAKQANATVDEGHFSFSNLRTQANDLLNDYELMAQRKKPARPGQLINSHIENGGVA